MENNKWIPVSKELPKEREDVQVTYLGYNDNKPYCNGFAYYLHDDTYCSSGWYWSTDDSKVIVKIVAWRINNDAYLGE